MPLHVRDLPALDLRGLPAVGGVRTDQAALFGFRRDTDPVAVSAALGGSASDYGAPGILLARTADPALAATATPGETGLLKNRNVIFAIYQGEAPDAVPDWLRWHHQHHGSDGVLIYCCSGAPRAEALQSALSETEMDCVLVRGDAATPNIDSEEWLSSFAVLELLRHAYLAEARAVAFLTIADLVLPDPHGSVFDRAEQDRDKALPLRGTETFPWRLHKGRSAPHGDHVAVRLHDKRQPSGWCVVPGACPADAVWRPGSIAGMPTSRAHPAAFRRAMSVASPGMPLGKLTDRRSLVEDAELSKLMAKTFGRKPTGASARQRVKNSDPDHRTLTIVTAMKNEGPFILDWISHHRAIGAERFLVYTNDCSDGTDGLLDLLGDAGVTRRENPFRQTGGVPQHAAFQAAAKENAVTEADWLMTLDVDEYLNIRAGKGLLADLFSATPGAGAISLPWRLFGNADIAEFRDEPVTRQFHLCAPEYAPRPLQSWAFKTLYRNDGTFRRLGVHRPKALDKNRAGGLNWVDGSGRPLPMQLWQGGWRMTTATWGYDLAGINHYAVRSAESFLVKRDRGRVNHVDRDQGLAYWFRMNHNVEEDRSIRRLDTLVAAERARLVALPGVAEAHAQAAEWHRARIADLRNDPEQADFFSEITGPRLQKLSRLTPNFGSAVYYAGPDAIPDAIADRDPNERFYFTI